MNRVLVFLLLLCAAGATYAQSIGRVIMAVGDVSAQRAGANVPLRPGTEIQTGDQMRTGTESYAQVRFTDGAIVALRSETEFRVDEYRFSGKEDGSERAFFQLVKGGFRTVTGIIGKLSQPSYKVITPTSTIGIRGTHFNLVQCDGGCRGNDGAPAPNGTYGGVSDGRIAATPLNNPTERQFGAGEFFHVANANTPATPLLAPPGFLTDKLEAQSRSKGTQQQQQQQAEQAQQQQQQQSQTTQASGITADGRAQQQPTLQAVQPVVYSSTELKTTTGTSTVLPGFVPNGFVIVFNRSGSTFVVADDNSTPFTADSQGQLLSFGPSSTGVSASLASGTITDSGASTAPDGTKFAWGVWTGGTLVTSGGTTASGVPVMFGTANDVQHVSMPTGGFVRYSYAGGPHPRDAAGNIGNVTSSDMVIDFGRQHFDVKMSLAFPDIVGFGPASMTVSGGGNRVISSNAFDFQGTVSGSCTGAGCQSSTVSGSADAATGGSNGYSLGVAAGGLTNATRGGSVIFLNAYNAGALTSAKFASVAWSDGSTHIAIPLDEPFATLGFSSAGFSSFTIPASPGAFSGSLGSGTIVEAGSDAAASLFWGRWVGPGTQVTLNNGTVINNPITGVPFVGGDRTDATAMPTSGTAIFNYAGGPNPVSASGTVGTFTGGSIGINFVSRAITSASYGMTVGSNTFSITGCTSGCTYSGTSPIFLSPSMSATCTGPGCSVATSATLRGHFTGASASGLAISGLVTGGPSPVVYAAGFKR
jgi:hypothetical protein